MKWLFFISIFSSTGWSQDLKKFVDQRGAILLANQTKVSQILNDCKTQTDKLDIENRQIADEVISGMGAACFLPKTSVTNVDSFMLDVKKAAQAVDQNKIWDDTTKIALQKSIEGFLALHLRVVKDNEVMTASKAQALVCEKISHLCSNNRAEFSVIKRSITDFLEKNQKSPVQYLDGAKQEILKTEFNKKIDLANETCALTKKKYKEIEGAHSCVRVPPLGKEMKNFVPMTVGECERIKDSAYFKHKELERMSKESINLNMQLLISSELGPLFATASFRKSIGILTPDFVYQSCMKGNGVVLNKAWHASINEARGELYSLAINELKAIQNKRLVSPQYVDKEAELEKYLKTNPLTVSKLLTINPDPVYAKAICYYIKDIYRSDKISNYVNMGLMTIGAISSIAFGFATAGAGFAVLGSGAAALAAVSIGTTSLVIGKNSLEYFNQLREDQLNRQSIATQQRNLDKGIEALNASDIKKDELISNIKWSGVGLVIEVVGVGFVYSKAVTLINELKKSLTLFTMVKGTTQMEKAENLHKGSQLFTKLVQQLKPEQVGQLKNLSIDRQTKLAAIFSTLDETKGKLLVEKLSHLKAEEFNQFMSVIDGASTANVSPLLISNTLDDFSKTGIVKKIKIPLTPEEIAKLGPKIPTEAKEILKVYPEASTSLQKLIPELKVDEIKNFISTIRKQYNGMVKDNDIAMMVEKFSQEGIKSTPKLLERFEALLPLKQKYPKFFEPNGLLNLPFFKDEGDLIKLAYLDDLERYGIPLRNSDGDLLLTSGQMVMRQQITSLTPTARAQAIEKELNYIARDVPCSL